MPGPWMPPPPPCWSDHFTACRLHRSRGEKQYPQEESLLPSDEVWCTPSKKMEFLILLPLTSGTVRWNVHGKAKNCFFLGIWAKVLITVNKDVDFLSCKKIKKKFTKSPNCAKPGTVNSFFVMQSDFPHLLFADDLQKTKTSMKYMISSPLILKTLRNRHSNICFLLIIPEKFININMTPCSTADPAHFAWEGTFWCRSSCQL